MSYRKIIALAEKFIIKLAAQEETNPGGRDIGSPEYVGDEYELPSGSRRDIIGIPQITEVDSPTDIDKSHQLSQTTMTDPGSNLLPHEKKFADELYKKLNNIIIKLNSVIPILKETGYFSNFETRMKEFQRETGHRLNINSRYIEYLIDKLEEIRGIHSDRIYMNPKEVANQIANFIGTEKNIGQYDKIIELQADINYYLKKYALEHKLEKLRINIWTPLINLARDLSISREY